MAEHIVPHSVETEKALLGCLIVDQDLIVDLTEGLEAKDFYNPDNQQVFAAISGLQLESSAIDYTTVKDKLVSFGGMSQASATELVAELIRSAPLDHNVREYSKTVKDYSIRRQLIEAAGQIQQLSYQKFDSVKDLLEESESRVFRVGQTLKDRNNLVSVKDGVIGALEQIDSYNKNKGKLTGIGTGFVELDRYTSGLQDTDLIIIAARPSMGKTSFALNIATYAALKEDRSVLIFSLEMSQQQLIQRMLLSEACINNSKVKSGDLTSEDWIPLTAASNNLSRSKILINDTPGISLLDIRAACRRAQQIQDIELIIIDYMQLMSAHNRRENRQNEISEISRGLKQLAREMDCPVICLSQLARGPENRQDKKPMLSDLRDSGAIEQDADVVMFLYRDSYYNKEDLSKARDAKLILAKQRNGPIGEIDLFWNAEYTRFTNPERYRSEND